MNLSIPSWQSAYFIVRWALFVLYLSVFAAVCDRNVVLINRHSNQWSSHNNGFQQDWHSIIIGTMFDIARTKLCFSYCFLASSYLVFVLFLHNIGLMSYLFQDTASLTVNTVCALEVNNCCIIEKTSLPPSSWVNRNFTAIVRTKIKTALTLKLDFWSCHAVWSFHIPHSV